MGGHAPSYWGFVYLQSVFPSIKYKIVNVLVAIHKDDKHKIKLLLRQLIPDLFFSPRQEMSDDEDEGKGR